MEGKRNNIQRINMKIRCNIGRKKTHQHKLLRQIQCSHKIQRNNLNSRKILILMRISEITKSIKINLQIIYLLFNIKKKILAQLNKKGCMGHIMAQEESRSNTAFINI
jgi:hypothetical protein